jgi:hypothetical protein
VTGELRTAKRLRWLVAVHIVLAAAPLVIFIIPVETAFQPLIWVLFGMPFGCLMTLSVWVGMGSARIFWRLAGALAASAYAGFAIATGSALQMVTFGEPFAIEITSYLQLVAAYTVGVIVFGGMFRLLGHRFVLRRVEAEKAFRGRERFQFNVFHVLIIMMLVAVILTLVRATRREIDNANSGPLNWSAHDSLAAIAFFLNTFCAAYAALWPSGVKRNLGLVLVVSVLLGIVLVFAMHQEQAEWWLFVGGMFMAIIPTLIEVASLLIVRSCGYRLVRRSDLPS